MYFRFNKLELESVFANQAMVAGNRIARLLKECFFACYVSSPAYFQCYQ